MSLRVLRDGKWVDGKSKNDEFQKKTDTTESRVTVKDGEKPKGKKK